MSTTTIEATPVAHHFDDLRQQQESHLLGMWVFLAQEVMFFGGLFGAYLVYRVRYPEVYAEASQSLAMLPGFINTVVLLVSSYTMALSVNSAQRNMKKQLLLFLSLTWALGMVFLFIKAYEYHDKYVHHHIPGSMFAWPGVDNPGPYQLFFVLYFIMTGMHALHMVIGVAILAVIIVLAWKGHFNGGRYMKVELFGFYWHFVDIVWIFLFPLLYLVDRHSHFTGH